MIEKAINERADIQINNDKPVVKNDIYRKFKQLMKPPVVISDDEYVDETTDYYQEEFDNLFKGFESDVRFFVGYTGVGKSTFIRHYLKEYYDELKANDQEATCLKISSTWNGRIISDSNYTRAIDKHISDSINAVMRKTFGLQATLSFPRGDDIEKLYEYIDETRNDVNTSPSVKEIDIKGDDINNLLLTALSHSETETPVEYASSKFKYFLENTQKGKEVKRILLIIDDVEMLSEKSLVYLVEKYFSLYSCLHNFKDKSRKLIINILFSLRPHSFRYLGDHGIPHEKQTIYGLNLDQDSSVILKNSIPSVCTIIKKRFETVYKNNPPKEPKTWEDSKNAFFRILDNFDNKFIAMIADICHMNIRAIMPCLQRILSNRTWCQESKTPSEHPAVIESEFAFDNKINIIRTLACGECEVYMGMKKRSYLITDKRDVQPAIAFDHSEVFIPNILIDINNRHLSILIMYILLFLEYTFSLTADNPPSNKVYIQVSDVIKSISSLLNLKQDEGKLFELLNYLFTNRIIRKSLHDKDNEDTIDELSLQSYIYLSHKGHRLLNMFNEDSILLEIYREDIVRNYDDIKYYKSSLEFVTEKKRDLLFEDLIALVYEVFKQEDELIRKADIQDNPQLFQVFDVLPVSFMLFGGVEKTIARSSGLEEEKLKVIKTEVEDTRNKIETRKKELITIQHYSENNLER